MEQVVCKTCQKLTNADECRIVVIDTDTSGTVVSRKLNDDSERFTNRYHTLIDEGRYPNMSNPYVECKSCKEDRHKKIEEELEYWRRKNGDYD